MPSLVENTNWNTTFYYGTKLHIGILCTAFIIILITRCNATSPPCATQTHKLYIWCYSSQYTRSNSKCLQQNLFLHSNLGWYVLQRIEKIPMPRRWGPNEFWGFVSLLTDTKIFKAIQISVIFFVSIFVSIW